MCKALDAQVWKTQVQILSFHIKARQVCHSDWPGTPVLRCLRKGIPGTWGKLANRTSQTGRGQNQ